MSTTRSIRSDIFVVLLLASIVFLVAALVTYDPADDLAQAPDWLKKIYRPDRLVYPPHLQIRNACGFWGAWFANLFITSLGYGAFFLVAGLITLELALVRAQGIVSPWVKTLGWMLSLLGATTLCAYLLPGSAFTPVIGAGGYVGALCRGLLAQHFATTGGLIITTAVTLVGLMMWTEYLMFRAGRLMFAPALVAASKLLPFGLLHRFFTWFNGMRSAATPRPTDLDAEEFDTDEDDVEEQPASSSIKIKQGTPASAPAAQPGRIVVRDRNAPTDIGSQAPAPLGPIATPLATPAAAEELDEEEELESTADEVETLAGDDESIQTEPEQAPRVHAKPHFAVKAVPPAVPVPVSERDVVMSQLNAAADAESGVEYELPKLDLLLKSDSVCFDDQKREALAKAEVLERTCQEFGYNVRVVEIETGPVISQYEIQLEAGLRLQKITALADDLAIALRVPSVRIVAPIPGKNTVGVEVPNETRQVVRLREVIEQSEAKTRKMKIPLFLGKDAVGAPMVVDLASLPHLLIAGRTGTGKSVCLNAIITSILMTRRPDEVRMLMIDPKMVELSGYARLPHLMHPVVTDMRKAEAILAWAVDKMEERYALLARAGVRHITSYNQLGEEELMERLQPESDDERSAIPLNLPFIVIVADEMADLMMTCGKEVEQHIIRLAQKSRAVGIHLILATQKPTVDVITGLIKSNLPARIAFQVASKMDSRVVLDAMGADKLLGNGDMLFLWPGTSNLLRGQGTYLTDEEIESVTESVSTGEQNFVHELMHIKVQPKEGEEGAAGLPNRDDMYAQAVDVVIREGRGSVSLLQRALGIGYGRAARLIDFMEQDGIVGNYNGSKSREVIMSIDQWQQMQAGSAATADPEPAAPQLASSPGRVTKLAAATAKKSPSKPAPAESKRKAAPPVVEEDDDQEEEIDGEEEAFEEDAFADEYEDAAEFDAVDFEESDDDADEELEDEE
ncbi:MAG: DNA translocase FtsK [Planctomycetota bacterium]